MKRFIINILMIFSLLLTSGCVQESVSTEELNAEIDQQDKIQKEDKVYDSYKSILDYNGDITGEHFKTGILNISKEEDKIHFKIKVSISPKLKEKMMNTEEAFYFNITDFEGKDNLTSITADLPLFTKADLNNMKDGKNYLIEQSVHIEENVSSEKIREVLLPENYELQLLSENKQVVAVIMGLELNMIY